MTAHETGSWYDRNYFLLRRLHSLTGIVPVGAFLINHLLTNSTAALGGGGHKFDEHVFWIHSLPFLVFLEFGAIILPLFYHALFGIVIALTGKSNVRHYSYADNWRYTLQRLTGWIAFVFILVHLGHFRFVHFFGGPHYVGTPAPFHQLQLGFSMGLPMAAWMAIYMVGLVASVYHFANGIVTFCISWGITVNDSSRQKVSMASAGLGVVLIAWGAMSLWAIANVTPATKLKDASGAPAAETHETTPPARASR
ncbi:MAG: succinate dehydrogenase [Phycisphaerae bacterium]|nr:succinate dehydrogenase [Phycisphaerae bacterium]